MTSKSAKDTFETNNVSTKNRNRKIADMFSDNNVNFKRNSDESETIILNKPPHPRSKEEDSKLKLLNQKLKNKDTFRHRLISKERNVTSTNFMKDEMERPLNFTNNQDSYKNRPESEYEQRHKKIENDKGNVKGN